MGNSVLADRSVATYVEKQEKKNFFPSNIFLPTHLALRTAFFPSRLFDVVLLSSLTSSLFPGNYKLGARRRSYNTHNPTRGKKSNFQQQNSWASSATHFFPTQVHTHTHAAPLLFCGFFRPFIFCHIWQSGSPPPPRPLQSDFTKGLFDSISRRAAAAYLSQKKKTVPEIGSKAFAEQIGLFLRVSIFYLEGQARFMAKLSD